MKYNLEIPESMDDLTLAQWQELMRIDKDSTEEFYTRRVLQIVYGIKGKDIDKIKASEVKVLIDAVTAIFEQQPEFSNRFRLDGVEYGLVPNFDDMTFGELVDLDKYSDKDNYHLMMGILYRPVTDSFGDVYKIEPYHKETDLSRMPAGIATGCIAFFLTLESDLMKGILNSLTEEERVMAEQFLLEKSGVGLAQSMNLVEGILKGQIT